MYTDVRERKKFAKTKLDQARSCSNNSSKGQKDDKVSRGCKVGCQGKDLRRDMMKPGAQQDPTLKVDMQGTYRAKMESQCASAPLDRD